MKPIAVIILNWNGEKLLHEFLPSVVENTDTEIAQVIVADNGSTDGSVEILKKEFPSVELIDYPINHGFAKGYNLALEACRQYEYCVLLNSDVAPAHGWVNHLYEYMQANHSVGACQPKILSYAHKNRFEYAGACGGFLDKNGYPFCRGRIFDVCETDTGQYDEPMNVFWATGAALMVRTNVYLQAGGLDPLFFAHMEEIDLCWRIHLLGYDVAAVPSAAVYHLGGGSLPASNPKKTYLNFRNNLLMLHKNLPDATRRRKLLRRRLLDTLAWAKFVATLDFKNAAAVWRAHRDFASMRKNYDQHPTVDLLNSMPYSDVNILMEHYAHHHSQFSTIKNEQL